MGSKIVTSLLFFYPCNVRKPHRLEPSVTGVPPPCCWGWEMKIKDQAFDRQTLTTVHDGFILTNFININHSSL